MTATTTSYFVFHSTVDGELVDIIKDFMSLEYTLTENDFGSMYLDIPDTYLIGSFKIDDRLEVIRSVSSGDNRVEGQKPFFIRLVRYKYDEDGKRYIHILAYDSIHIISRRIIAYPNNTPYTLKNGPADNVLVAIFRENFGDLVADLEGLPEILTRRKVPDFAQHYEVPSGNGLAINTDDMSRLLVLPRMQEIADMSRNAGIYLSFDYVFSGYRDLTFKTYIGQRGSNHGIGSPTQLLFSVHAQNLSYSSVEYDHTEVKNFVYAGGRGQDTNRLIETEADYAGIALSPFNRIEDWLDVDTEDIQEAADQAAAVVRSRMPKTIFNGHVAQTPECLYGVDYGFGDIITVIQDSFALDVHLDTVNIKVKADTDEEISIMARNYDEGEY